MALDIETIVQIQRAYKAGYERCLVEHGKIKPYISLHKAFELYGRKVVNDWLNKNLIELVRDDVGKMSRLSREQLELLANSNSAACWAKAIRK